MPLATWTRWWSTTPASAGTTAVYTTTYSYNLAEALAQVTDAAGNVTSMGYDLLGRKTAMSNPDMGQWQYQYDAAGNLTAQRDGRNLWLYLGYDELNRLTSKRQDDPVSGSLIADYSYDAPEQLGLPRRQPRLQRCGRGRGAGGCLRQPRLGDAAAVAGAGQRRRDVPARHGLQRGGAEDGVDLSRRQRPAAGRGRELWL